MTEEPRWWRWLAVLALAAGVLVRAWPWLCEPLLFFEDGTVFFGPNYPQLVWGNVAAPYAGYVPFGSNLAAVLLCRLPTDCIASAFVATSALVQLAAAGTVLRPAFSVVAPFWVRCMLAACIALLPIGSHIEFTTLAYMQWPMLCWLFLLLIEPRATQQRVARWRSCCEVVLVVLLTLSHPLAAILAPLALRHAIRSAQHVRWLAYAAALLGYWIVVGFFVGDHGAPAPSVSMQSALGCVPALLVRVGLGVVIGHDGWTVLAGYGQVVVFGVAGIWCSLVTIVVSRAWKRWQAGTRTFAGACLWLLLVSLIVSFVVRGTDWQANWIVRYLWLARVALLLLLVLAMSTWRRRWLAPLLLAVVAAVLTASNTQFHGHVDDSGALRRFLDRLKAIERRDGARVGIDEQLVRGKQPPIVIRAR